MTERGKRRERETPVFVAKDAGVLDLHVTDNVYRMHGRPWRESLACWTRLNVTNQLITSTIITYLTDRLDGRYGARVLSHYTKHASATQFLSSR